MRKVAAEGAQRRDALASAKREKKKQLLDPSSPPSPPELIVDLNAEEDDEDEDPLGGGKLTFLPDGTFRVLRTVPLNLRGPPTTGPRNNSHQTPNSFSSPAGEGRLPSSSSNKSPPLNGPRQDPQQEFTPRSGSAPLELEGDAALALDFPDDDDGAPNVGTRQAGEEEGRGPLATARSFHSHTGTHRSDTLSNQTFSQRTQSLMTPSAMMMRARSEEGGAGGGGAAEPERDFWKIVALEALTGEPVVDLVEPTTNTTAMLSLDRRSSSSTGQGSPAQQISGGSGAGRGVMEVEEEDLEYLL